MVRTPGLLVGALLFVIAITACGGYSDGGDDGHSSETRTESATTSPTAAPTLAEVGRGGATPAPTVAMAMVADLAARLSTPPGSITVVSLTPMTWPNSCLGLGTGGQVCAAVLTPGWLAILRGPDGTEYRYRGAGERFLPEP